MGLLLFDEPSASLDPIAEHGTFVSLSFSQWANHAVR